MSVLSAVQRFRPNPQPPRRKAQATAAAGGFCLANCCRVLHVLSVPACTRRLSVWHHAITLAEMVSSLSLPKPISCLVFRAWGVARWGSRRAGCCDGRAARRLSGGSSGDAPGWWVCTDLLSAGAWIAQQQGPKPGLAAQIGRQPFMVSGAAGMCCCPGPWLLVSC